MVNKSCVPKYLRRWALTYCKQRTMPTKQPTDNFHISRASLSHRERTPDKVLNRKSTVGPFRGNSVTKWKNNSETVTIKMKTNIYIFNLERDIFNVFFIIWYIINEVWFKNMYIPLGASCCYKYFLYVFCRTNDELQFR